MLPCCILVYVKLINAITYWLLGYFCIGGIKFNLGPCMMHLVNVLCHLAWKSSVEDFKLLFTYLGSLFIGKTTALIYQSEYIVG